MVDLGHSGTSCVPVFDSRPLISQAGWSGIGGGYIVQNTRELLGDVALDLDEDIIHDLNVRFGRVSESASTGNPDDSTFTYSGFGREFDIPTSLLCQIYEPFFQVDQDGFSISDRIVQTILKCPIDARRIIAANLVFCGGYAMVPGLHTRILDQVRMAIGEIAVNCLPCAFKPNTLAWVGGS